MQGYICIVNKKVGETEQDLPCRFIDFVAVKSNVSLLQINTAHSIITITHRLLHKLSNENANCFLLKPSWFLLKRFWAWVFFKLKAKTSNQRWLIFSVIFRISLTHLPLQSVVNYYKFWLGESLRTSYTFSQYIQFILSIQCPYDLDFTNSWFFCPVWQWKLFNQNKRLMTQTP